MKRWIVVGVGFLLTACATYDHPTASLAQQQRDEVECSALAEQGAGPVGALLRETRRSELFVKCLSSRGWVKR